MASENPMMPRAANHASGVTQSGKIKTELARNAAATAKARICPTRDKRRGPAKQPRTKPAKYQVPRQPTAISEKPTRCARNGVNVPMSPFPIRKRPVETRIAAMLEEGDAMFEPESLRSLVW